MSHLGGLFLTGIISMLPETADQLLKFPDFLWFPWFFSVANNPDLNNISYITIILYILYNTFISISNQFRSYKRIGVGETSGF